MLHLLPVVLMLGAEPAEDRLAAALASLATDRTLRKNLSGDDAPILRERLRREGGYEAIGSLNSRKEWEKRRDAALVALQRSLGTFPKPPRDLKVRVRKTIQGIGYTIQNITFESRPGLLVTANLYSPAKPGKAMPGIIICHSHHHPKTEVELQDMGVMWARAGCVVLVMDQLGHGERRQHPFRTRDDYPKPYLISRQDYFHRYHLAIQLQTIGDSLMGWMVWDLRRGVDLLLARPGIDKKKIIMLGSVAGGGDPVAVAGALDRRIACVGPFNFGGPQPETPFPLPKDPQRTFGYAGSGSWESTRNLAGSVPGGFFPWVIVGAIAPRKHLYAHEFSWDKKNDPVWKLLLKIHGFYGSPDTLFGASGLGTVRGKTALNSHCNNIGKLHRIDVNEALKEWFGIDPTESKDRQPASALLCLTAKDKPGKVHELADTLAGERLAVARKTLDAMKPAERRKALAASWTRLLGTAPAMKQDGAGAAERWVLYGQKGGIRYRLLQVDNEEKMLAMLLLPPRDKRTAKMPIVVAVAQGGPAMFLKHRSKEIADTLRAGKAVVLANLGPRAGDEPGENRGRKSQATAQASTRLMLGDTSVGVALRYLRAHLANLRQLAPNFKLDARNITLWADNVAEVNKAGERVEVPLELKQPHQAEPLGGIVALPCALYEDGITSIRIRGGLVGYRSLLSGRFAHVPYDIVVPGVLTTGDLADVVAALAPLPIRLEGLVDGLNRRVSVKDALREYKVARDAYKKAGATKNLVIVDAAP